MTDINYGTIDTLLLFGGGSTLINVASIAKSLNFKVLVITSPRHLNESKSDGDMNIEDSLNEIGIGLNVLENLEVKEVKKMVSNPGTTFALSFGAAWIFKEELIELFDGKFLNCHGTRLPQNRGGGGFSWQILMGNRLGFCILHKVEEGIDTGDIVCFEEFLYPPDCRIPIDYMNEYKKHNIPFLKDFLLKLINKESFSCFKQSEYFSSYWPRLNTDIHGWIDWHNPLDELDRFICAFDEPYTGSKTQINGEVVRIKKCMPDYNDSAFHAFQHGIVYRNNGKWLSVAAKGGTLIVEKVIDLSNKNILADIPVGTRLYTDQEYLKQFSNRVSYTPSGVKA